MRVLLGAYVLLYASIHPQVPPFSDSCLWGSWHPGRQIHLFSHSVRAQPCSLESPKSHQHQHRHVPMYSAYCIPVIAAELHEYISTSICKVLPFVRSFVPPSSIYIHNNSTISLQHYCITIIVFKVRSHARRPCAPTHLCRRPRTLPQSTNQRPCRTLYIRRFRS
jgi:hypothetical protein